MNKEALHQLGKISKAHGFSGELILVSEHQLDDSMENLSEIFIVVDGLLVPFPVEEFSLRSDTSAQVKLEFVDSLDETFELLGCDVYADIPYQKEEQKQEWEKWIGFTLRDDRFGEIGIIVQIEDFKGNIVLQVVKDHKEILISLFPELIISVDKQAKVLHVRTPDGYF
ncbi:MAG: hypothetical protein LBQ60_12615 [Bacteroidales bacterium]|jgi:16S rRNA processing protein RimM|nr:hypothetical protein [Bacteroidales bacterium]